MTQEDFRDKFKTVEEIKFDTDVPLKDLSCYRAGGIGRTVWYPSSAVEVALLIDYFNHIGEKFWVVGGGANTIFDDDYIETALISTAKLNNVSVVSNRLQAGAGVVLDVAIRDSIAAGLGGLESLSGIPGTVGGALWMNAGAFGSEVGDRVVLVTVVDNGIVKTLSKVECDFNYRSAIGLKDCIVISAEWELEPSEISCLQEKRKDILSRRAEKQPLDFPSCGSVFKRPEGDYASRLIDEAGLKGFSIGGAQVSEKHAGFIINRDGATSSDILALISHCQSVVKEKFGVELELEQQLLRK